MKKFLIPLSVIVFVISAGLVWYFGYHHQTQEEPIVVTKETHKVVSVPGKIKETHPSEDVHTQTDQVSSDDIQEPDELQPTEASEQFHTPHDHSHVSTPEYEARVKEARAKREEARAKLQAAIAELKKAEAERIAAQKHFEETEREALPHIMKKVEALNALSAKQQQIYWERLGRLFEVYSESNPEVLNVEEAEDIVRTLKYGFTEYGYQEKY